MIEFDFVVCRTVGQKHLTQIQTLLMLSQLNWLYPQQRYVLKSQWLVKYYWNHTKISTSEFYVTNNQFSTVTYKSTIFLQKNKTSYLYILLLYMSGWAVIDLQFLQL